jgi:HK97 family phage major capsid protein
MSAQIEALVPASPLAGLTRRHVTASIGEQFVRSAAYDYVHQTKASRPERWASPIVELHWPTSGMYAATLTEDPASGGKLVVPDFRPGILESPTRVLTVADLIAPGMTTSNLITYMVEKTYTNAAAPVAEGTAKPESAIVFDAASDPVRKIAHWLPVTEEMLEDVAFIRSYLDARLRLGVQLVEDDQLLNGTTTAPDIVGIRNRTGLAAPIVKIAGETIADAIFRQIMAIANSAMVMPDGIVMNPINWQSVPLMKNSVGDYVGDGPFRAPGPPVLWGLPVAVTPAMPVNKALVGAFGTAAQVFRKGGIRVDASNSHQDFFVKNLVAIRAEERLALSVYRPGAFGEVTSLNVFSAGELGETDAPNARASRGK